MSVACQKYSNQKDVLSEDECQFWLKVRNDHAVISGKKVKEYTKEQILKWYNRLHTDSSEYKMWGNGIALPCALYVMEGIADCYNRVDDYPPHTRDFSRVRLH